MQNLCGPFDPMSSPKPPTGTRHVPVTNCRSLVLFRCLTASQTEMFQYTLNSIQLRLYVFESALKLQINSGLSN